MDHEEIIEKIRKIEKKRRRKPTEEQIQQAAYTIELLAELTVDAVEKRLKKKK